MNSRVLTHVIAAGLLGVLGLPGKWRVNILDSRLLTWEHLAARIAAKCTRAGPLIVLARQ